MHEGSRRAIIAAFFANAAIAVAKLVGFVFTGAASMLAEAVHSGADSTNQLLLLLGGSRGRKIADRQHPFGYGRERYFWSFVVALVIFTLGGLFALYEGIEKMRSPHEIESVAWAIGILSVAMVAEAFSLRTAVRESAHAKGDQGWWHFVRHSKSPELPVVLLEDVGAMFGLALALAGVVVARITGNPRFDAAGSIAIGVLLVTIAVILVIEMKSLLIGEGASPATETKITDTMQSTTSVTHVIHLRTQHLGPEELLVGAKLAFDDQLDVAGLAAAINDVETRVRAAVPEARVIYIEPDLARSAPAGPTAAAKTE